MQSTRVELGIQLHISSAKILIEQVAPVENDFEAYHRQKPKGGLWTSSWQEETSAWVEWCRGEDFDNVDERIWWLLTPRPNCKLYIIDSLKDFQRCLMEYGEPAPLAIAYPVFAEKRVIDFEKLAQEFDGVHLTERGNGQTHLSYPNDLNAWDCESTLWFRWCFTEVRQMQPVGPIKADEK